MMKPTKPETTGLKPRGFLRWLGCRRGVMAVEFALIFPIFLLAVLAIMEVGRAAWIKAGLQYACEDASRYMLARPSLPAGDAVTRAQASYAGANGLGNPTFTVTTEITAGTTFLVITGSQVFNPLVPFVGLPTWTLTATSRLPQNNS